MTKNNDNSPNHKSIKQRKRGIRASRSKLETAKLNAGFETQTAIAIAVAKLEGTDQDRPPVDMVRKVFSGRPVDPITIERIARVLKVEAYTLYLNEDEATSGQTLESYTSSSVVSDRSRVISTEDEVAEKGADVLAQPFNAYRQRFVSKHTLLWLFFGFLVLTFLIYKMLYSYDATPTQNLAKLPHKTIALISDDAKLAQDLRDKLRDVLPESLLIKTSDLSLISDIVNPWDVPKVLRVDYALHIRTDIKERHVAFYFNLYEENSRHLLFADVMPRHDRELLLSRAASVLNNALLFSLNIVKHRTDWHDIGLNEDVIEQLQAALVLLDKGNVAEFVEPATTLFYRALRQVPTYKRINAYLCLALTRSYIYARDPKLLDDAQKECDTADTEQESVFARAELFRRQGNLELAESFYKKALELNNSSVDSLIGLSETYLARGIKTGDTDFFNEAIELSNKAHQIDPDFWRATFTKGRIYYLTGSAESAIKAFAQSAKISPNFNNLTNLATANFCYTSPKTALNAYQKAVDVNASTPIAYYNLSSIYSYFERYEEAASAMDQYIALLKKRNSQPQLEGLIGAADIYRLSGQLELANSLYMQAKQALEQKLLERDNIQELLVKETYITLMLEHLKSAIASNTISSSVESLSKITISSERRQYFLDKFYELEKTTVNPNDLLTILFSYFRLNDTDGALRLYQKVAPMCKGFAEYPALRSIARENSSAQQSKTKS